MGGFDGARLAIPLVVVALLEAVLLLWPGGLAVNQHHGDTLHIVQILMRMADGQVPHLDFMTPIGVFSFLPSYLFLGYGVGTAILAGQVLVMFLVLPMIWWAVASRMQGFVALAYALLAVIMVSAIVHGGVKPFSSVSMYYNRWAWAFAFAIVSLALLPPRNSHSQLADGLVFGLGMSFLAMAKATFFVALLPAVVAAIILRAQWRAAAISVICGIAVAGLITWWAGDPGFLLAYVADVRSVSEGGVRAWPGESFSSTLAGPGFIVGNAALLAGIVFLRQAERPVEGVILLLLAPGFAFITFQNWGNEQLWLAPFGLLMLALRTDSLRQNALGWNVNAALGATALAALTLSAPVVYNMGASTLRYARLDRAGFAPVLALAGQDDLYMKTGSIMESRASSYLPPARADQAQAVEEARAYAPDLLNGEEIPFCGLDRGLVGLLQGWARDLDEQGLTPGKSVFIADTASALWLFGQSTPVPHGAPWYYGGDQGLSRADFLLVPFCPVTPRVRQIILTGLQEPDAPVFREVARTDHYILLRRAPDGA